MKSPQDGWIQGLSFSLGLSILSGDSSGTPKVCSELGSPEGSGSSQVSCSGGTGRAAGTAGHSQAPRGDSSS